MPRFHHGFARLRSAACNTLLGLGCWLAVGAAQAQSAAHEEVARLLRAGLAGDLRWTRDAAAVDSALRLQGGALYGIGLGPARLAFRSAGGELRLRARAHGGSCFECALPLRELQDAPPEEGPP